MGKRFGVIVRSNDVGTDRILIQQAYTHCGNGHFDVYQSCVRSRKRYRFRYFKTDEHSFMSIPGKLISPLISPWFWYSVIEDVFRWLWNTLSSLCGFENYQWPRVTGDSYGRFKLQNEAPGHPEKVIAFFKKYILDVAPPEPCEEEIPTMPGNPYPGIVLAIFMALLPMLVLCLWLHCCNNRNYEAAEPDREGIEIKIEHVPHDADGENPLHRLGSLEIDD